MRKMLALFAATVLLSGCSSSEEKQEGKDEPNPILQVDPVNRINEVLEENPENPGMLRERGNAYFAQHQFDQAIADYSAALEMQQDPKTYYNRGVAYCALGDHDKALADYSKALLLDPTD